jgi:hypothetical protein
MNPSPTAPTPASSIHRVARPRAARRATTSVGAALLVCGILSSLVYAAADIMGGLSYAGYSFAVHTVSELSAIGAPTRPLMIPMFLAFGLLVAAFGFGIRRTADGKRALRVAGLLVIVYGVVCMMGPLTPMHRREVIAAGGATLSDTLHITMTFVDVALIIAIIVFASTAFGRRFRIYSAVTVLLMIVFGTMTGLAAPRLEQNLPTPTAGLTERINIYGFLVWFAVLAVALLRARSSAPDAERVALRT